MRTSASLPVLTVLRERIQRLERGAARHWSVLPFGIETIDQHLPEGGLALGALHEVASGGNGAIDGARRRYSSRESPRARGARSCGASRAKISSPRRSPRPGFRFDRVIYVDAGDELSVLACFEEGLRHGGLGAVVAEVTRLSMTRTAVCSLPPKDPASPASPCAVGTDRWRLSPAF